MPPRDVGAVSCSPANKDQDEDAFDAFFFFFAEKLKKKRLWNLRESSSTPGHLVANGETKMKGKAKGKSDR